MAKKKVNIIEKGLEEREEMIMESLEINSWLIKVYLE